MGRKVENLDLATRHLKPVPYVLFPYAYRDLIHIAELPQEKNRLTLISAHILTVTGSSICPS